LWTCRLCVTQNDKQQKKFAQEKGNRCNFYYDYNKRVLDGSGICLVKQLLDQVEEKVRKQKEQRKKKARAKLVRSNKIALPSLDTRNIHVIEAVRNLEDITVPVVVHPHPEPVWPPSIAIVCNGIQERIVGLGGQRPNADLRYLALLQLVYDVWCQDAHANFVG
jgi:hypothetical protein